MALISLNVLFVVLLIWQIAKPRRTDNLSDSPYKKSTRFIFNILLAMFWIITLNLITDYFWYVFLKNYQITWLQFYFKTDSSLNLILILALYLVYDYVNYWWHRLNHSSAILRHFHKFHHSDFFVDISTTFRFHYVELTIQYFWTFLFAIIFKLNYYEVTLLRFILIANGLFHHSNIKFSLHFKWLSKIFVTPEMHWNHHQSESKYANSNYGSFLNFWDKMHNTYTQPIEEIKS